MRIALAFLLLVACAPSSAQLVVDLRTDLVPPAEFFAIDATLRAHDGTTVVARLTPAFATDDLVTGERILEGDALAAGDYDLVTDLVDPSRHVVVSRTTHITLSGTLALTVVISRDCRGIVCPSAGGNPLLTTCSGGVCVDPRCTASDRTYCPPGCSMDTECSVSAACARARCVDGTCLAVASDDCTTSERCDPEHGCVPVSVSCDAPLEVCGTACTNTQGDPAHCGSCTMACTAPVNAMPDCASGTCGFVCLVGYAHCGTGCTNLPCSESLTTAGTTTFEVPDGCTRLDVVMWGAGGGTAPGGSGTVSGSAGGFASGTLSVTPHQRLTVVVGGAGGNASGVTGGAGGIPGGGAGASAGQHGGGGGGGYTGVFSGAPAQSTALLIAGGGGGAGGAGYNQGAGGGSSGESSTTAAGTQTAGGVGIVGGGNGGALVGGAGASSSDGGGGGGAGWFGGAGARGANSNAAGGGGGSGYAASTGVTSAMLVTGAATTPPMATDARRGTAGSFAHPGAVLLSCE